MRDFEGEINLTDDINTLREILIELQETIEYLLDMSYEGDDAERSAHNLELIYQYGERKLEQLLS